MTRQPAVFLDRDNTLIANDGDLGDPDEVRLLDGVRDGLQKLREHRYRLVVVTNQGGVARGLYTEAEVDAVHQRIAGLIDDPSESGHLIDRFYYCPYHPEATVEAYRRDHPWRKPNPGMLLQAAHDLGLDLERSWIIGDQPRDVRAGQAASSRTVLINNPHRPVDDDEVEELGATIVATTFEEAVDSILARGPAAPSNDEDGAEKKNVTPVRTTAPQAADGASITDSTLAPLHAVIRDLAEEMRTSRLRRTEFTPLRMGALLTQLGVLLFALLGLLQIGQTDLFYKWMVGAGLIQLFTIALLLMDHD